MSALPASTTALVLIDLQKGVVGRDVAPYSAAEVVAQSKVLASRFRAAGAPVILVNVAFSPDFGDALKTQGDPARRMAALPPDWTELADGLAEPGDLRVTKRQPGAFYGTDLDLQLRRRGVTTIVLGGIATNNGVEATARAAHEHGYALVLVEDAMAGLTAEMHNFAVKHIFPMLGSIAKTADIQLQR